MTTPADLLGSPYQGYLYAYPHKTSYRTLEPRPRLADLWAGVDLSSAFGYVHIPFCEMRCGFCNLFTRTGAPAEQVSAYLDQLAVQTARTAEATGPVNFAAFAIGGGTPTYLEAGELERLFAILGRHHDLSGIPIGVETSPATATPDRLRVLADHGVNRVSIGVQSFDEREARAAGRPQRTAEVEQALDAITETGFEIRNLDLIFGIDGQTPASWLASLARAMHWRPEEIYLYPLYVRPLTGLGRREHSRDGWDRERLELHAIAVDFLTDAGYVQDSLRRFRRADAPEAGAADGYSCQDDPMIGLGCGARSYTPDMHYSFDYAVAVPGVRAIIEDYLARPAEDFDLAEVGRRLSATDQRRRWLIKSLLKADGVDLAAYRTRFGTDASSEVDPRGLVAAGLADVDDHVWRLTREGLAWSDAIGPWLVDAEVADAMASWVPR